jgi:hypothetical protein
MQSHNENATTGKDWWRMFKRCNRANFFVVTAIFLCVQGCAQKVHVMYIPQQQRVVGEERSAVGKENVLLLKRHYEKWRGTPYEDGGLSRFGIDCSGYTVLAYRDIYGLSLPRTAGEQAESGREVSRAALKTGDLVFFNTGRSKRHVGIYLTDDQFIHASLTKGVTLSSLDDSYWQEKYWKAIRLQAPNNQNQPHNSVAAIYRK